MSVYEFSIDDVPLQLLEPARMEATLAPKAAGALALDELLDDTTRLVLFSSVSTLLAPPGQAAYVGANEVLGALGVARAQRGAPTTTIDWGIWADVGMTSSAPGHRARDRPRPSPS